MLCNRHLYLDLVFLKILSCQIKCILLFWYIHKNTKGKLFTWLLRQYVRKKVVVVRFGYLMLTQIKQACFLLECIGLVKSELRQAMYTYKYILYVFRYPLFYFYFCLGFLQSLFSRILAQKWHGTLELISYTANRDS